MKKLLLAASLLAGASLWMGSVSGHGGTYRGPGDTVPPGAGGGGGGGTPTGPTTGGPGTGGPSTGGPTSGGPVTGGPTGGGPAAGGPVTPSGSVDQGPDLDQWSFWWEFNKDRFLNLRAKLGGSEVTTGSQDFFLGQGERSQARDTLRPTPEQIEQTIVPALLKALKEETNNDIITGCLIALAKIGDPTSRSESPDAGDSEYAGVIREFLKSSNQEISETAAVALGILAHPSQIDLLVQLMQDGAEGRNAVGSTLVPLRTRAFAAYALALIGAQLKDDAEQARRTIVGAFWQNLEAAPLALPDVSVAAMIGMGLVRLQPGEEPLPEREKVVPANRRQQIEYILRYFQDHSKDYLVRAHVPTAVARLLDGQTDAGLRERTVGVLLPAMASSTFAQELRGSVAMAMGLIGDRDGDKLDRDIRKALEEGLKDATQQVKNFSLLSLGRIAARPGTAEDADKGRTEIERFLGQQLSRGTNNQLHFAALAVGAKAHAMNNASPPEAPSTAMVTALLDRLKGAKSENDVGAFAIAAGMFGDSAFKPALLEKLDSVRADEPRGYVAVALGLARFNEAREPIQKIILESEYRPELLKQAAIALGLLGDRELVPDLLNMLQNARGLATQASISSALGFIGDRRSVDPLVDMLQNKTLTDTARGFAAVALGIVADKEMLPWNAKIGEDLNYRASTSTLNDPTGTGILNIL